MKKLICLFWLIFAYPLMAQDYSSPILTNDQPTNIGNYNQSIIYVFFNNEPCQGCAEAISIIENIYNQQFANEYNLFIINYQKDWQSDFIRLYDLSKPLEVVLVRVDDGGAFGYRKLTNLQYMTSDPVSLQDYFIQQVDNFLEN